MYELNELNSFLHGVPLKRCHDVVEHSPQVEGDRRQIHLARFDLREVKDLVDDVEK